MRPLRLTAVLLVIGGSAGACTYRTEVAAPPANVAAPAFTSGAPTPADPCGKFVAWLADLPGDRSQTAVGEYDHMRHNPDAYTLQQKTAVRQAYYAHHEQLMRDLATTGEPAQRKAFLSFADELAEYASNAGETGPARIFPEGKEIAKVCNLRSRIDVQPIG
ncbi:hypothetical protein [Paractinoplanes abujensis]|uniref:Lipoprotein n=1 Tax=Paractinoplanes abujensis TaxID=882441 RepID=A0A7W7CRN4_9ACTN|nr:hypothetical protein [Actinoplanes abujensis]MBB4693447.1 hypothetical protein [Actinoplanes abujensis]